VDDVLKFLLVLALLIGLVLLLIWGTCYWLMLGAG